MQCQRESEGEDVRAGTDETDDEGVIQRMAGEMTITLVRTREAGNLPYRWAT